MPVNFFLVLAQYQIPKARRFTDNLLEKGLLCFLRCSNSTLANLALGFRPYLAPNRPDALDFFDFDGMVRHLRFPSRNLPLRKVKLETFA